MSTRRRDLNRKLDAALRAIRRAEELLHGISFEAHPSFSTLPETPWRDALHDQAGAAKSCANALYMAGLNLKRPLWRATEETKS